MNDPKPLLSELLRPQQLGDLALPLRTITRFQRMIESGSILNMLFYGEPGRGKTSAARILINALGPSDSNEYNGSDVTGVDFVRERIVRFSSSLPMNGGKKICFIDEAEYLSQNAQAALRKVIEDYSCNCRYVLATNNISKVILAIRSRLMPVCFDTAASERTQVQQRLLELYEKKLSAAGITFDTERLIELVGIYYPDLRAIANAVQFEFEFA